MTHTDRTYDSISHGWIVQNGGLRSVLLLVRRWYIGKQLRLPSQSLRDWCSSVQIRRGGRPTTLVNSELHEGRKNVNFSQENSLLIPKLSVVNTYSNGFEKLVDRTRTENRCGWQKNNWMQISKSDRIKNNFLLFMMSAAQLPFIKHKDLFICIWVDLISKVVNGNKPWRIGT